MKERLTQVAADRIELKITLESAAEAKLKRARELVRTETLAQLIEKSLEALIEREEKKLGKVSSTEALKAKGESKAIQNKPIPTQMAAQQKNSDKASANETSENTTSVKNNIHSRYIPTQFKQVIFNRSQGRCEFVDQVSNRRCESKSHLEIDHVKPLARNGTTKLENLRHLCRNHNARAEVEWGLEMFS